MNWTNYYFSPPSIKPISNPTILAFSCYFHDSSACILKNGTILAAVDEERFSRKKHDAHFPARAIQYCLETADVKQVDFVVFYENPDMKWERIKESMDKYPPPMDLQRQISDIWGKIKSKRCIQEKFKQVTGLDNEILFLDHHFCHAASSYFVSNFEEAAVVVIDGVGEKFTTSYGRGYKNELTLEKGISFPHSIGLIYTMITVFLGFKANDHEYKVMGLAPYGELSRDNNPYYKKLTCLFNLEPDGSFMLNLEYFGHEKFGTLPYTSALSELLQLSRRSPESELTLQHKNLAAALQLITEDLVFHVLNHVQKVTGAKNLCYSGGVALNSVLNGKIISQTKFEKLFIQPSAGDSGTVIGAAKYIQYLCDPLASREHITHASLGPASSYEEIKDFLIKNKIVFVEAVSEEGLVETVAELLEKKNVVGWVQERMEWGPRALGNRSILASPLHDDMRDILNEKVKHRELFRPFAPVVCVDDADDYFECDHPVPEPTDYMLMVYPIKKEQGAKIPAVTHVDGSGRLQTIRREQNPLYYDLIKHFGKLTGVPILVNTSFNIRGEPIVCSPEDAYRCMMGTEIDYLVLDKFIIARRENLKDAWVPKIND